MTDGRDGNGRRVKDDIAVAVGRIETDVAHIKTGMEKLVTRDEFEPVRKVVYGAVALILFAVLLGVIGLVVL